MTLSAHDVWKWRWKYTVPSVALLIDCLFKTVYSTTLVQKIFTTDKFSILKIAVYPTFVLV